MASNRIKGITVEIGGDTSELNSALKDVDKSLKSTQTSLKDVNKLLKLDPGNISLLQQKSELLKKSITDTKERLKQLNDAYKNVKGDTPEEVRQKQEALKREIIATEQSLKSLKNQYNDFGSVAKQKMQAVGDSMKNIGGQMQQMGGKLSASLTAPIVGLGAIGVNYNAQLEQYRTMFTTLTGSAEEADRIIAQLQADAQKSPFDSATLIKANQYLISAGVSAEDARNDILNLGNAVAATGGGSAELERMASNLQQIKNVGKASSQDIKQFANAGINIYGLLAEATGKTVEEVKDMDVSYELLSQALAAASAEGGQYYGAMEAQSETLNGSIAQTKESIQMLLGEITEAAMPVIKDILEKIQSVVTWLSGLDEGTKKTILTVAAIVAAIGPVVAILGTIISGVGSLISAISFLASPIGAIVLAIGAVIAVGVLLYKNWDTIKEKATQLWDKLKEDFQQIKDFISSAIEGLVQKFISFKDTITSVFSFDNIKEKVSGFFSSIGDKLSFGFGSGGFASGGFGSSGFASGGMSNTISINNTFTINNASNLNEATLRRYGDIIGEQVNEYLGRLV